MSDWREQEVQNETQSREINEWIQQSNDARGARPTNPYICECSDDACAATISLTHVEYEEVRAHGATFAIALDHESPDLDLLVSERTGFAIIRKLPGLPARLATASDPRRPQARP
ncbi:MAG: hypothetical protein E6F95_06975 [Actinobacteria bacterium]|nr:MAG: hypothetical protein E6F95_06975 [Actinomycetota bacterium]